MKDYEIERHGSKNFIGKLVLIEQCNFNGLKKIGFYYWAEHEMPVEFCDHTVAFFRVKQRKRVSWWKRVFKRVGNFR